MGFEEWTSREDKFQSFFGPGVTAKVLETSQVPCPCASHVSPVMLAASMQLTCLVLWTEIKQLGLFGLVFRVHTRFKAYTLKSAGIANV
jgi:hypothetical protein